MRVVLTLLPVLFLANSLSTYEAMYEKTPVGEIKVITLPGRTALESKTEGSYFRSDNGLFRKLFRYISSNDIAMTVPVEADIEPGRMRFFVGGKDSARKIISTSDVKVRKIKPQQVLSIGVRGSYSMERFNRNKRKLTEWLAKSGEYEPAAEAYAVYWDGPFVIGFFKRSEVHLPIKPKENKPKGKQPSPKPKSQP